MTGEVEGFLSEYQALAKGTDLIFALELFSAVSALWLLNGVSPIASVVVPADNDSADQGAAKRGPDHSHLEAALWFLAARESLSI